MMDTVVHPDCPPHSRHEQGSGVPKEILIADDEEDVRWLLVTLLKEYGFEPVVARDGAEAVERVRAKAPEVVLMDVRMPILDGIAALRTIRASQPEVPIIMITAYGDISSAVEAMKLGAYDYVTKPFDNVRLVRAVVGALERRALGRAMRESYDLLRAAIEGTTDAVFVKDLQGQYLTINTAGACLFGRSVEEVMGRYDSELFSANRARDIMQRDSRVIATGETQTYEETIEMPGVTRTYLSTKGLYRNHEGKPLGLIGISRDITERVRAEEALKASEARFRGLFEHVLEGVYQAAPDGRILTANPAFASMLGYASAEELQAAGVAGLYVDQKTWRAFRHALQETGEVRNLEVALRAKDGRTITALESARAVRDPNGGLLYYEGSFTDITERKLLEDELRQAQKMEAIGRLAVGIAHDFNNVLTAILGYSELLLDALGKDHVLTGDVAEVKKAAERAAALTRQLLAIGRKQVVAPQVLDLNAVISNLQPMLTRIIGEDVSLSIVMDSSLGLVEADPNQVEQIILNLAANARDAMPEGGTLTVETARVELDKSDAARDMGAEARSYVMLAVGDTGQGMDAETRHQIFDPFFTTKGPGKGTGLGLSTVYGIVKQSRGDIQVCSEPGVGTTFKVYLPRVDVGEKMVSAGPGTGAPTGPETTPPPLRRGSETILLVEDEDSVRAVAARILQRHGYTVLEARDGNEALLIHARHAEPIDLLVTDVVMPTMSGPALAERLLAVQRGLKVLYVCGYAHDDMVRRGVMKTGVAYLPKPYRETELARTVREVLEAAR